MTIPLTDPSDLRRQLGKEVTLDGLVPANQHHDGVTEPSVAGGLECHALRRYPGRPELYAYFKIDPALKEHLTEVALSEFARTRAKLGPLSPEQEEAIKQHLLGSLVNKFLHPLIVTLREGSKSNGDGCDILELYHTVYNLKERLKESEEHEKV